MFVVYSSMTVLPDLSFLNRVTKSCERQLLKKWHPGRAGLVKHIFNIVSKLKTIVAPFSRNIWNLKSFLGCNPSRHIGQTQRACIGSMSLALTDTPTSAIVALGQTLAVVLAQGHQHKAVPCHPCSGQTQLAQGCFWEGSQGVGWPGVVVEMGCSRQAPI